MYFVGAIVIVLIVSYQYFHKVQTKYLSITSFSDCLSAGYKVLATYPETCKVYGKTFVNPSQEKSVTTNSIQEKSNVVSYLNQSYIIEGEQVQLYNGAGYMSPNTILKQSTSSVRIVGEPYQYDINGDGKADTIFLIEKKGQGSLKDSYFLTASVSLHNGQYGVNALFLDYGVIGAAFAYKNNEIIAGYTTNAASTTLREKYYTFSNDILKQITHK